MKKSGLLGRVNNEKGVAAVLVLAVILVLTTFGTIALVASAANISMGNKSRHWSAEYYDLDSQTEEYVLKIDKCLKESEEGAQKYLKNEYYCETSTSAAFSTSITALGFDSITDADVQGFLNGYYNTKWTSGGAILIMEDYITSCGSISLGKTAYQADIDAFRKQMFNTVYFFLASKKLDKLVADTQSISPGALTLTEISPSQPWTKWFIDLMPAASPTEANWMLYQPNDTNTANTRIKIHVEKTVAGDTKKVDAEMKITIPNYKTVLQKINIPYKGNPIWANAISAQEGITIAANTTIKGDVYTSGAGINIKGNSSPAIYGNVYCAGDLSVTESNSQLHIYSSKTAGIHGVSYDAKNRIYMNTDGTGNTLSFDKSIVSYMSSSSDSIDNYIDTSSPAAIIVPLVYEDGLNWGNVYCRNLVIKEGVAGSAVTIDGNLMTSNDIRLDGTKSHITIGDFATATGNYIGLRSAGTTDDINSSSSVMNNHPFAADGISDPSTITLNGRFIVPGTAYYEFDEVVIGASTFPYYQSAESITSRTTSPTAIFDAYVYDDPTDTEPYTVYKRNGENYTLFSMDIDSKIDFFLNRMGSTNVKTNIIHGSIVDGFIQGSAIMTDSTGNNYEVYAKSSTGGAINIPSHSENFFNFYELQSFGAVSESGEGALMDIFQAKTTCLGTGNRGESFDFYVDKSNAAGIAGLMYYEGDHTINIDTIPDGIVYCTGRLNLTSTVGREFKGTIICEKDVTISGSMTLKYDEDTIVNKKLSNYEGVRKFFEPVGMGGDNYSEGYSSTSGIRKLKKRYKILSWKESQG